jgi:hypothetical protein
MAPATNTGRALFVDRDSLLLNDAKTAHRPRLFPAAKARCCCEDQGRKSQNYQLFAPETPTFFSPR